MTPVYKKDSWNDGTNYSPRSVLSNLSKVLEKCMFDKMAERIDDRTFSSKYQCAFRKGSRIKKWKKIGDKGGNFGELLTDPSKAFDCPSHDSLMAKFCAYGSSMPSLKLVSYYFVKENESYD